MYRKRLYTTVSKYIPNNLEKMNIKDKNKLLNQLATLKQENKQNIDLTLPKIVEMNSIIKTNPSIDNKKLLNDYLDIVQNSNNEIPKINDSIDEIYESINEEEIYLNDEHNIKGGKSKKKRPRSPPCRRVPGCRWPRSTAPRPRSSAAMGPSSLARTRRRPTPRALRRCSRTSHTRYSAGTNGSSRCEGG